MRHLPIPFDDALHGGPAGVRCEGCLWEVRIGSSYRMRDGRGGWRSKRLRTLGHCRAAFTEHVRDQVEEREAEPVRPVPHPVFDWQQP